jgi:hypothetical protein
MTSRRLPIATTTQSISMRLSICSSLFLLPLMLGCGSTSNHQEPVEPANGADQTVEAPVEIQIEAEDAPQVKVAQQTPTVFVGSIEYKQTIGGTGNIDDAKLTLASKLRVVFGTESIRVDRDRGVQSGSVVLHLGESTAMRLNHTTKTSEVGSGITIDEIEPRLRDKMPRYFHTRLKDTGTSEMVCGLRAQKFQVMDSIYIAPASTVYVWIAADLELPRRRYQFNFASGKVAMPMLLLIPIDSGCVLKSEVEFKGVLVTTVATAITESGEAASEASVFEKPKDYEGPDLVRSTHDRPQTD